MMAWILEWRGGTQGSAVMVGLGLWVMVGAILWQEGRARWSDSLARLGFILAAALMGAFFWGQMLGSGGFSSMGALLGAGLVMSAEPIVFGEEGWGRVDLLVPVGLLGGGIARLGCLLAGCDVGTPTDGSWGVVYGTTTRAWETHWAYYELGYHEPWSLAVHPFGLYLGGLAVGMAGVGFWLRRRLEKAGVAALMTALAFFGLGSAVETLREPYLAGKIGGMLLYPWIYLALALTAAALLVVRFRAPQGERKQ